MQSSRRSWPLLGHSCDSTLTILFLIFECSDHFTPSVAAVGMKVLEPRPQDCHYRIASEQDVTDTYFNKYGKWQRPRLNASEAVDVNVTFVLSSIEDVLERERVIRIAGYISVRWFDEFRVWQDDFPNNCVDYLVLPATEVWLPDIAQMNGNGRYELMNMPGEKVRIYKNGLSVYSPGGIFSAFCLFDLSMFPFDSQKCTIQLESWRYTHNYLTFNFNGNMTIKYWTDNEQWLLVATDQVKTEISYLDSQNIFDHLEFHIFIKRKATYYVINVIIPSLLIAVAQLSTFSLPTECIEKIEISFTCLLAYSVFQVMVVSDMPRSSDNIPLLTVYIDLQMAYIAISMLGEGLGQYAIGKATSEFPKTESPDSWMLYAFNILARAIALPSLPKKKVGVIIEREIIFAINNSLAARRHDFEPSASSADEAQMQWRYIATVIGRLNFVLYLLSITFTPLVMFTIYPASRNNPSVPHHTTLNS